jgi:antitoxin YefM
MAMRRSSPATPSRRVKNREPLAVITRGSGRGDTVTSEEEFEGWQETMRLLRSPRNAERLLRSIRAADGGKARRPGLVPAKALREP